MVRSMIDQSEPNPFAAPTTGNAAFASGQEAGVLAGRGTRLAASIIDTVLLWIPLFLILFLADISMTKQTATQGLVIGLGGFALWLALNGYLLHTAGQTLGKKFLKIRIVRRDGRATTDIIVKRMLPIWAISLIPFGGVINLINALCIFRKDRRCLHDLIADTKVIALKNTGTRSSRRQPRRPTARATGHATATAAAQEGTFAAR